MLLSFDRKLHGEQDLYGMDGWLMVQKYYYVRVSKKYPDMDSCVEAEGSGMLVADHKVLDDLYDAEYMLKQLREENQQLREKLKEK